MSELEALSPMTPAGCDLRDFPHTPLFRSRLFGSTFHARSSDAEWRAGVTLWLKSWDQVPAGSLPADDIDLCRLAELARDIKAWLKVKVGALRGWLLCSDGRLYHPVVAEGVNNALEAKSKQRLKTAKARIAALEKHLKEAKTADDKARITGEIERIRQTVSQTLSQTVSLNPREGEERGKEKGLGSSVPKGTGGEPPAGDVDKSKGEKPAKAKTPEEMARADLWRAAVSVLRNGGCADESEARVFMGKLVKDHTFEVVREAVAAAVMAPPPDARGYLVAACLRIKGERRDPVTVPSDATERTAAANAADDAHLAAQDPDEKQRRIVAAREAVARLQGRKVESQSEPS